ncbi:MAG: ribonuclease P protein subunit [Candidatus Micrarchaeota archaeon]|nr:ribonuclease P protein subunit [Candidatus Micrarchaeota archaeon]
MMESIMVHEWIGRRARIIDAANRANIGLVGTVVDETLGTITLRGLDGRERVVPKRGAKIALSNETKDETAKAGEQIADGSIAAVRPEDRAKKLHKKIK